MLRRLVRWMTDPTPPAVRDDRAVEVAWLPLWQAQLVVHELWEHGVPCVMSEDFTSRLRLATLQPMARIFVMEPRLESARGIVEQAIGHQPPTLAR